MKVPANIFRAYDLRGLVDEELNPELVEHIGKGFGTFLQRQGITKAVVSRDSRQTSPEYSQRLIAGLVSTGVDVIDIGLNLIGTFYWAQHYLQCQGGVYVSASHNPPEFNGFKFANDYSETFVTEGMVELRRLVETEEYDIAKKPGKVKQQDIRKAYAENIIARVPLAKKLKVVVDPSCTTAGAIAPDFLRAAGCEVVEYHTNVDSSFPLGVADPTEAQVLRRLGKEVLESKADIGFTYDADGDRIGVVDEKGQPIWSDVLVALFAAGVLHDHPGAKIMYNVFCSKAVTETIVAKGGQPFMWRTGHSFLKKKNQEVKAAFIGELSGHFFFSADFYNHDDGLYSTLRLLQYLGKSGQKLSELVAEVPFYASSPEVKLACAEDKKVALVDKLVPILTKDFPGAEVIADERAGDGVRVETDELMFVVRYSQNGPYLGIKLEAKTKPGYAKLRKYLSELLHRFPEVEWDSPIQANTEVLE